MGQITLIWMGTPRWLRGWFLGSTIYILFTLIGLLYENVEIIAIWPGIILPASNFVAHLIWSGIFAIFIGWLGEVRGSFVSIFLIGLIGFAEISWSISHANFVW